MTHLWALILGAVQGLAGLVCGLAALRRPGRERLAWLLIAAVIQTLMIRAREITDRSITLKNVHEDFVEAFNAIRRKRRSEFDRSYADGVMDYDEKLRRRRQRPLLTIAPP